MVNGSPVWAAEGGEWFMYRSVDNRMTISDESACAEGRARCYICNTEKTADVVAPTELPSDEWVSNKTATLATQYASAERLPAANGEMTWARVPDMGFTPVHGLDDDDPAMAEALAKLAAAAQKGPDEELSKKVEGAFKELTLECAKAFGCYMKGNAKACTEEVERLLKLHPKHPLPHYAHVRILHKVALELRQEAGAYNRPHYISLN